MSIKVHMKERKAAERVEDLMLIRIKIRDVPADTVVQLVERRQNKLKAWVRI